MKDTIPKYGIPKQKLVLGGVVRVLIQLLEITKGLLIPPIKIPRDKGSMLLMEMYEIGGCICPPKTLDMGVFIPTMSKLIVILLILGHCIRDLDV